jgi:hypothetical protein
VTAIIIVAVVVYLAFHLGAGARQHRRHYREHGVHPNLYYTYGRGWYGSIKLGGFRVGHRL